MTAKCGNTPASCSTGSSGFRRTPTFRPSDSQAVPSDWKRRKETIRLCMSEAIGSSSATCTNASSIQSRLLAEGSSRRRLMSLGIDSLLERGEAHAAIGVQEALRLTSLAEIGFDEGFDG